MQRKPTTAIIVLAYI